MIKSPISDALADIEGVNIKKDITLIDLDDKEGYVSFKTMSNAKKQAQIDWPTNNIVKNIDISFSEMMVGYITIALLMTWFIKDNKKYFFYALMAFFMLYS